WSHDALWAWPRSDGRSLVSVLGTCCRPLTMRLIAALLRRRRGALRAHYTRLCTVPPALKEVGRTWRKYSSVCSGVPGGHRSPEVTSPFICTFSLFV
ncbi:hypothetical protein GDO81_026657, partial [Engystomops pustulosus]